VSSLHDYLQADPECRDLAMGAVLAVGPLLEDPDPGPLVRTLEAWVLDLAGRMPLPWSTHAAVDTLNHYLFQEQGLQGDRETFDDPDNVVLPRVVARRRGLPITLSILWIDVARRLGFDAIGVGLPGHFITGLRLDLGTLYFDPFQGGLPVGEEQAATLVRRATSGRTPFEPAMLGPLPHRAILMRLVRSLHARYLRTQAWDEAFWTATHLVLLSPEDPLPYRDRAFVRLKRGEVVEALRDLQEAIRLGPESEAQIVEWMERMKKG
jgi:regulator of sirC expression with transglutaminase-like and TPR domain